ncbi:sugar phosphate isomerase/epimerase family protein [Bradyrhizobium brasilense]|uniref:sugar phosphate isomerase/epimerase family protein n=1 Tax=Bradyrhizobium brasilense TaxID=1419277 RepID=UPI001E2F080E|nr:sugar phosphate isomerase/epimerase [Bradyrhizobium brasilense]
MRDLLSLDFEGTIRHVAKLGYNELEFAGVLGASRKRTRRLLAELGISSPSAHVAFSVLKTDLARTLDLCSEMNFRYLVCPWIDEHERQDANDWKRISALLNRIGETARRYRVILAYHNHDFEFMPLQSGELPYDIILERTDPDLVKLELDVYWVTKGKGDPSRYLRRFPQRFPLLHLKDMAKDGSITEVGAGVIDFVSILRAAKISGTRHYFVEQDYSADPIASITKSYLYLRGLKT